MRRRVFVRLAASAFVTVAAHAAGAPAARNEDAHADALFPRLERIDVVREGPAQSRHVLYVFFDANCLYCHLTWKALQPYEAAGLQVRWVPVAYQQPSSIGRAAAIMQAPDRAAALRRNEIGYDATKFDGGIEPAARVAPAMAATLEANTRLMRQFGAPGTPALVWKDAGGNVRFKAGVPRQSELPHITGLPLQPNADPDLAPFR